MTRCRTTPQWPNRRARILDSALSGAELTRRLLAFARRQPLQPRRIDLNVLIPNQVAMLRRTLGETIDITTTLAPDLWLTSADASQIGDALLNLALNARDAMPHGGSLTITTSNAHLEARDVAGDGGVIAGDFVVLAVNDTGLGMPRDVAQRATEPFFSTKPTGAGSGLGLSIIYGFARQSGGHLLIDSKVGVGTTVKLYLPRASPGAVGDEDATAITSDDPGGDETILLVDDNVTLRDVARRHLKSLGYHVSVAEDGPAAMHLLRSAAQFDLLFTDIVMPQGMTGYELAEAARTLRPKLRVLFTTGYAGELDDGQPGGGGSCANPIAARIWRKTSALPSTRRAEAPLSPGRPHAREQETLCRAGHAVRYAATIRTGNRSSVVERRNSRCSRGRNDGRDGWWSGCPTSPGRRPAIRGDTRTRAGSRVPAGRTTASGPPATNSR